MLQAGAAPTEYEQRAGGLRRVFGAGSALRCRGGDGASARVGGAQGGNILHTARPGRVTRVSAPIVEAERRGVVAGGSRVRELCSPGKLDQSPGAAPAPAGGAGAAASGPWGACTPPAGRSRNC